jgi:4-aminobutyrate aminotransferase/(S)-3-amino-2-methylpropionate transaminase
VYNLFNIRNENAYKLAFMYHQYRERKFKEPTKEELESTLTNSLPGKKIFLNLGTPNLSILSFKKGFHGRTMVHV